MEIRNKLRVGYVQQYPCTSKSLKLHIINNITKQTR